MSGPRTSVLHPKRRRALAIWMTLGLAMGIAALTLVPLEVPANMSGGDKVHHVVAFAALTLPTAALYPRALLRVVLAAVLYGAAIEIIQPYVQRHGEFADFTADVLGVGIGTAFGLLINRMLRSRARGQF